MKVSLIFYLLLFFAFPAFTQMEPKPEPLQNIEQLSFMKGTWKGEGWIMINRQRKTFTQTETIRSKVENTLLVIDGIGYAKDSTLTVPKIIHNAFGVISYNEEKKEMTMLSFASTGGKMENQMKLIGSKKLEWSFKDERGGTVRFREDFSVEGEWAEQGDYSFDGEKWFPFFSMKLKKLQD